eukprot:588373-Amphidinium_carterae.1
MSSQDTHSYRCAAMRMRAGVLELVKVSGDRFAGARDGSAVYMEVPEHQDCIGFVFTAAKRFIGLRCVRLSRQRLRASLDSEMVKTAVAKASGKATSHRKPAGQQVHPARKHTQIKWTSSLWRMHGAAETFAPSAFYARNLGQKVAR